jgi:soluble lytic murein transglycosylase
MNTLRFPLLLMLVFAGAGSVACSAIQTDSTATAAEQLAGRIGRGDQAVLDTLDPTPELVENLRDLNSSLPYSLGRALESRGLVESARVVYRLEMDYGDDPWGGWSALRLATIAASRDRWEAAEGFARRGVELFPENRDLWFRFGEAVYRRGQYRELRELTDNMPGDSMPGSGGTPPTDGTADTDEPADVVTREGADTTSGDLRAERLLWRAVAAYELGEGVEDRFREAFLRIPAHPVHGRLFRYVHFREASLSSFSPETALLLQVVYRSAIGEHAEARRLTRRLSPEHVAATLRESPVHGALLETIGRSAGAGDGAVEQWLLRLAEEVEDDEGLVVPVRTTLARYAEVRGNRTEAMRLLALNIDDAALDLVTDWLRLAITAGDPLPEVLERLLTWDADPSAIGTAVDRLLPVMVRDRRWDEMETLFQLLPDSAEEARAQLAVVTVLAARDGYLEIADRTERLEIAARRPAISYYGLLARRLQENRQELFELDRSETDVPHDDSARGYTEVDHAEALFTAGLTASARDRAMSLALLPRNSEWILQVAHRFHQAGHVSPALDLARRAITRGDISVGPEDIEILYPRPFPVEIRAAAGEYNVSPTILYGLIREESHFNPRARSPVGATGLTQVMPATAEDLVRRLGWSTVDLESVSDNVRMGAFYLDYLAGLIPDSVVLQLASYNAGLGRGRGWSTSFGDLSPELQVEALPFIETRWYLRRIGVSSAWYTYLTEGGDPADHMFSF